MPSSEDYAALLADNERLRDELFGASIRLRVYAYWVGRIHKGERDAISLAECCLRDIAHAEELETRDVTPMPRSSPPASSPTFPRCLP